MFSHCCLETCCLCSFRNYFLIPIIDVKCVTLGNAYVCCVVNLQLKHYKKKKKEMLSFFTDMIFSILPLMLHLSIINSIACLNRLVLSNMKTDCEMSSHIMHLFSYNQQSASSLNDADSILCSIISGILMGVLACLPILQLWVQTKGWKDTPDWGFAVKK